MSALLSRIAAKHFLNDANTKTSSVTHMCFIIRFIALFTIDLFTIQGKHVNTLKARS